MIIWIPLDNTKCCNSNLQTQTIVAAPQPVTLPVTQTGQNVLVLGPSGYTQTTQVLQTAPGQPQMMSGAPGKTQVMSGVPGQPQVISGVLEQPQVMSGVPGQPVAYVPGQPSVPQPTAPGPDPTSGKIGDPQIKQLDQVELSYEIGFRYRRLGGNYIISIIILRFIWYTYMLKLLDVQTGVIDYALPELRFMSMMRTERQIQGMV